jgi:hypothetical protein
VIPKVRVRVIPKELIIFNVFVVLFCCNLISCICHVLSRGWRYIIHDVTSNRIENSIDTKIYVVHILGGIIVR